MAGAHDRYPAHQGTNLIRAFPGDEARRAALDDLYGSEAWLRDYDERVMGFIESYQTAVFPTSAEAVDRLLEASQGDRFDGALHHSVCISRRSRCDRHGYMLRRYRPPTS